MQIKRLHVDKHLCLKDFEIEFQTVNGGSSVILIGENGSGKSTMLKTILDIILSFDMLSLYSYAIANKIDYNYEINYEYAQKEIRIIKNGKQYIVDIDGDKFCDGSLSFVKLNLNVCKIRIFPERVIAFYSGNNNSFYENIKKQNTQYLKSCKKIYNSYIKSVDLGNSGNKEIIPKRNYVYCDESFVPIYLCSILAGNESFEKKKIMEGCNISRIEFIDVSMKIDNIDDFFDYRYVNNNERFKERLTLFIDYIDNRFVDLFKNGNWTFSEKKVFFTIQNIDRMYLDSISIFNFFEKLKIFCNAEILVYTESNGSIIKDTDLSEGQRQLIKVLGMLGVCKDEDCLVLMDEPDSYMNPRWKYEIKETIDNILSSSINTQAIISTHDPLVINGVSKEFIRIFERNNETGTTKAMQPESDNEGMGIDGLLQSEYYGLRTVLDTETKKKLDKKYDLMVKSKENNDNLKESEKLELEELTKNLEDMIFSRNIPTDIYYDEYVAAMHKIYREKTSNMLSKEEIDERNAKAEEILRGLLGE